MSRKIFFLIICISALLAVSNAIPFENNANKATTGPCPEGDQSKSIPVSGNDATLVNLNCKCVPTETAFACCLCGKCDPETVNPENCETQKRMVGLKLNGCE